MKRTFRPEFLNRIDEIIIFDSLTPEQIHQILDLFAQEVESRLVTHGVAVSLTGAAKEWLAREGYDPVYGARPLRRTVQRYVENPLSTRVIAGEFARGDHVVVDADAGGLTFQKTESSVAAAPGV